MAVLKHKERVEKMFLFFLEILIQVWFGLSLIIIDPFHAETNLKILFDLLVGTWIISAQNFEQNWNVLETLDFVLYGLRMYA